MNNNLAYTIGKMQYILRYLTDAERQQALTAVIQNIPEATVKGQEYDAQNECCNPNADFAAYKANYANLTDIQKQHLEMNEGWQKFKNSQLGI